MSDKRQHNTINRSRVVEHDVKHDAACENFHLLGGEPGWEKRGFEDLEGNKENISASFLAFFLIEPKDFEKFEKI